MLTLQKSLDANRVSSGQAAAKLLERREQRRSLAAFTKKAFQIVDPGAVYKHNYHIDLISEYLEACYTGDIRKLIINIPPRFMKSIITTVAFPAWVLGQDPQQQIGTASYSSNLATEHSVATRTVMQSLWYQHLFKDTVIAQGSNLKTEYDTTKRGKRWCTSVGGTATGKGGNILIADDPMNPKQALSDTERDNANKWFDQTWSSRLNDPDTGVMIVIMQRLHQDDTTGHLLEKGGWEHLSLPMEAEHRTVITFPSGREVIREPGELLHEERASANTIQELKTLLGSYGYAGQYQQRPAPIGGGIIKLAWFPRYNVLQSANQGVVHSWDTAQKAGELNDFSACSVWHEQYTHTELVDVYKKRMEYPELKRRVIAMAARDNPYAILIEDKSSGSSLLQDLRNETSLPVIAIEPTADKVTRMSTVAPTCEAGNVHLPESAPWLHDFEAELEAFPNGAHRVQGDCFSQYLNWKRTAGGMLGEFGAIGDTICSSE